jgi:hypothetical protein
MKRLLVLALSLAGCTASIGEPGVLGTSGGGGPNGAPAPRGSGRPGPNGSPAPIDPSMPIPTMPGAPPPVDPTQPPPPVPSGPACDQGPYPAHSEARRLTVAQYQNAIRDIFDGHLSASTLFPGSYGKSVTGFSTEPAINAVGQQDVESIMEAAEEVAVAAAAAMRTLLPCSATTADQSCVSTFVDKYVQRAFRRPIAADERATLLAAYQDARTGGATFAEGVAMMLALALESPEFLYVTESAAPAPGRALDAYELASRLSFFLWDSVPDDALRAQAASGALSDPATLAAAARRLLADPKADAAMTRLFREWTRTAVIKPGDKDSATFPSFDDALASSMAQSFDRFVVDQARTGTLQSFLTTDQTWVDAAMADFLGVPRPASGWQKVAVTGTPMSGLGTQPEFLASAAHPTDTSYVFRGRFFRKQLLCTEMGPPPANAQATFQMLPKPPDPTGKDLSMIVRANPACAACHDLMDPMGLSLEGYDAIGRFRMTYSSGKAIDPSGTIAGVGDHSLSFTDFADLSQKLAAEPVVSDCFSRQILRFTLSRKDDAQDTCSIEAIKRALATSQGSIAETLVALTQTDAFVRRIDP